MSTDESDITGTGDDPDDAIEGDMGDTAMEGTTDDAIEGDTGDTTTEGTTDDTATESTTDDTATEGTTDDTAMEEGELDDVMEDDLDYGEDEDLAEEEWDPYDDGGDDDYDDYAEEEQSGAKKKKSKSDKVIIGLALAGGIVFVIFKVGLSGDGPAPSPAPQPLLTQQASIGHPAPVTAAPMNQREMIYGATFDERQRQREKDANATPKGFLLDKKQLKSMQQDVDKAADSAWKSYSREQAHEKEIVHQIEPVEDSLPMPLPDQLTQSANLPKAQDITIGTPHSDTTTEVFPDISFSANTNSGGLNKKLTHKLELIFNRLDNVEQNVTALQNIPPSQNTQQDSAYIEDLEKSIESLEKRIDKISKSSKSTATVQKKIRSATTIPTPVSSPVSSKKPVTITSWILKGAKPGQAWLSRKGDSEIYNISVGDTLPGIGRIVTIENKKGQWVVQGARGSIYQ